MLARAKRSNPLTLVVKRFLTSESQNDLRRIGRGPPMPRLLPNQIGGKTAGNEKSTPGTWLIRGGYTLLGVLGLDRYLQYREKKEAYALLAHMEQETKLIRQRMVKEWSDKPALFECIVREQYGMGGSHGLENVKLNTTVEILKEGVGPDRLYNLCRIRDEAGNVLSIGWYPVAFLEKKKRRWKIW